MPLFSQTGVTLRCTPKNPILTAEALDEFIQDVGIPVDLRTGMASEFAGRNSEFVRLAKKRSIRLTYQEAGWSNQLWYVDLEIRELKKRWHRIMVHK